MGKTNDRNWPLGDYNFVPTVLARYKIVLSTDITFAGSSRKLAVAIYFKKWTISRKKY